MSNRRLFITFLIPALVIFAGYAVWALTKSDEPALPSTNQSAGNNTDSSSEQTASSKSSSDSEKTYTRAEVATHNSASDCWTIINGNVYDLTSYIPRHPGGDEILAACGTDGSSLFNQRQASDGDSVGSGTPHSGSAQSQLRSLFVGKLKD